MPVTVATSFLVISLKAFVRPNPRRREPTLLFGRSRGDDKDSSDGDRDSDPDSDSDSEEDPRRPFPPTSSSTSSQTRTGSIMSTSQTRSSSGGVGGQTGTTIAFGNQTASTIATATSTAPPFLTLSVPSLSTSTTSTDAPAPAITGLNSPSSNVRISNGAIIGMTLGIVFLGALLWMIILKMVKRKRRARKLPRGFDPSTILIDSQSFRGSVTELPVAPPTNTTGSSLTSSSRARLSLSPFAALRIGSPSPPPSNPPPPPGLSGLALRRSSQPTSLSSYHTAKPISTLSSHPEERIYPEQDPLYLAVPPPPPPPMTGPRGLNAESAPSPVMSSVQNGVPTSYTSYDHPYRTSTAFQHHEYEAYHDEDEDENRRHKPSSHHDPPPSYGMAF